MTTPAREALYRAEHVAEMEGNGWAVYNPKGLPVSELPIIYGFNNGGSAGWLSACLLAEDGTGLGGHCCSHEAYMPADLGVLEGTRPDRHKDDFQKHYPGGYRMEFISETEVRTHPGLKRAYELNQEQAKAAALKASASTDGQLTTSARAKRIK
jgi:hypothetical protein